ncbi:hypothetical protein [Mesorhizobium sp. M0323]|uniref:hypothetical protein n=1 Tax=Mesorhizobium sp. M0323 TaxID=2956938 RepID=UPI00333B996B
MERDGAGRWQINRINYEICVLTALPERIRCKEIWVVGADRYRNPDEDLPQDFMACPLWRPWRFLPVARLRTGTAIGRPAAEIARHFRVHRATVGRIGAEVKIAVR